jgi:hypothetical protein
MTMLNICWATASAWHPSSSPQLSDGAAHCTKEESEAQERSAPCPKQYSQKLRFGLEAPTASPGG